MYDFVREGRRQESTGTKRGLQKGETRETRPVRAEDKTNSGHISLYTFPAQNVRVGLPKGGR